MRKIIVLFTILVTFATPACRKSGEGKTFTIAVVPKGTTQEFWKSVHAGAIKAAEEYAARGIKVDLNWKGPIREDDREQQIQVIEGFLSQNVNGIVLAPLDNRALVRPVEEAERANLPTVIIDSGLESKKIVSFVATDNYKGGQLAAERLGNILHGKGNVLLLRYQEGSNSTELREKGFVDKLKSDYPQIELISSDQHAGPTRDTAKRASENLLQRFANDVQGIFTPNESSTIGMLLALEDINKDGKIAFVGFDSTQQLIDAINNRKLDGFVIQNPVNIGYLGVKTMVDHLLGSQVEKVIDTGVMIVTPENINTPQVQELIKPPLERYLK
ncbi:MAG: ABC transporter substrate-binding protein [Pyrinomonadaceae bacterium]